MLELYGVYCRIPQTNNVHVINSKIPHVEYRIYFCKYLGNQSRQLKIAFICMRKVVHNIDFDYMSRS